MRLALSTVQVWTYILASVGFTLIVNFSKISRRLIKTRVKRNVWAYLACPQCLGVLVGFVDYMIWVGRNEVLVDRFVNAVHFGMIVSLASYSIYVVLKKMGVGYFLP